MNTLRNSFPGQEKDEALYVFARPYIIAFIPTLLAYLFIAVLALVFQFTIAQGYTSLSAGLIDQLIILGLGVFQLLALVVFMITLLDFYFDIVIVTDRRLVDIDQEQLFYRRISELALEDVEDVTATVKGFLPTMFNYGCVEVQTAGEQNKFIMENILHPREVSAIIQDLSEQSKRGVGGEQRVPESTYVGVIDGKLITNWEDLSKSGAVVPSDMRRYQREGRPNA